MCAVCFTTAQLVPAGAVAARWWYVNKRHQGGPSDSDVDGALGNGEVFVPDDWSSADETSFGDEPQAVSSRHRSSATETIEPDRSPQLT